MKVYYGHDDSASYPENDQAFSPDTGYPEYRFSDISPERNSVYELIREGFLSLGMDAGNYGKAEWNPLGTIICPGNHVLVKPNWVYHENREAAEHSMECLVTHPSVIRAVIDYVVIALKESGTITIADAPMQSCDFEVLMKKMHYLDLVDYYASHDIKIKICDLRGRVVDDKNFVRKDTLETGVLVDLKGSSSFADLPDKRYNKLRITSYNPDILLTHHTADKHEYLIDRNVLEADVIINMPKPKSHRKAGLTACAKNLVGTCSRKEYLPHHSFGGTGSGGDEYKRNSFLKTCSSLCLDSYNRKVSMNRSAELKKITRRIIDKCIYLFLKDRYNEGSWYGNDTIWRTIADLNKIIAYADHNGQLQKQPQRTIFNVCDMIVAGQGEGPLLPSPQKLGVILMGDSIAANDCFIARLFGFRDEAIPYIQHMIDSREKTNIDIVTKNGNHETWDNFHFRDDMYLIPSSGWKGHIEVK